MDFPGFAHFKGWGGGFSGGFSGCDGVFNVKSPDGSCIQIESSLAKELCTNVGQGCNAVGDGDGTSFQSFRQMNPGDPYDMYLAYNASIVPSSVCHVEDPNGSNWLCCDKDAWSDEILVSYSLPPSLIHSSCLENPKCVGFRVKSDQSAGDLLGLAVVHSHGCFGASWTTK
eukprot:CAMPEP_0174693680 /NCGR_PEP_ID=MMETSP1094-20130205/312_1 /TAXON_ID=156173 /ORGANISM="Chrysochromulina brevifilum, Strain UTEX LB 985" /LENGTH=170 /DNA_ID=CAMNT_0015889647 /DNA_START=164 /DNA_END=676 /DNA_ORIENTATION=+